MINKFNIKDNNNLNNVINDIYRLIIKNFT